jgi:cell wall-associated NlpC family hydrolase
VLDGRKHHHARAAAVVTAALTTMSLGLTLSPATAAPTQDIDTAQARVDKLSQKAATAQQRHEKAASKLKKARVELRTTTAALRRNQRLIDTLRAQMAGSIVNEYSATGGSAVPTNSAPALDAQVQKDSTTILANVVLVSEDAGSRGDALALSNERLTKLNQRKVALQNKLDLLARGEEATRGLERTVSGRQAKAAAKLEALEAKRIAEMGGPAVAYAKSKIGDAYVYGAAGPSSFDCSGLTMAAWSQAGVSLPHSSSAQYSSGRHISESELQPGDLVFYYSPISHVGMYIGNGQIVNALNPGAGVQISGLHDMPYSGAVRPGG